MELDPDAMVWRRDAGRNPGGPLYDDGVHKYATAVVLDRRDRRHLRHRHAAAPDFLPETPSGGHLALQGPRLSRGHRLHGGARDDDPRPLLPRRRVLRDPRLPRDHLGYPGHGRDARHARGGLDPRGRDTSTTRCRPTGASASTARRRISSTACWPAASRPRTSTPRSTFCKYRWRSTRPLASDARCHPTRSSRVGRITSRAGAPLTGVAASSNMHA